MCTGPSGIQQRVLEELMLSRWDSSPPLHHSGGSHSPTTIVIQDSSDSETDPYPGHTPSPNSCSQLPTNDTAETAIEQSEDPALLTTPSQGDIQTFANPGAVVPSNLVTSARDKQPPASFTATSDLITNQGDAQTLNASTDNPEQLSLMRTSTEAVAREGCKQFTESTRGGITSDEHLATVDSCPEVSSSSSSTAVISEKPVLMDDQVSSTSENLVEPISQLASTSAAVINQPRSNVLPHEEATPLLQSCDQAQDDDDDFEISLYAEDGGASLGEGSTPNSEILKKSRKDRDKSSRISELRKKKSHHHDDEHSREKRHAKSGSRHSESKGSSGSGRRGHESSSSRRHEDRGRHHRESRHRRSRSRSHSRSRGYRSHRRDSTDREYSSRSRHRSRSREREYSRKRKSHRSRSRSVSRPRYSKSHRSRSRSVSRPRYSRSCSSEDGDTFTRMKSTVVAKNRDKDEREHRHHHERHRRERSDSQSPHRHVPSHYQGDHDYERMSSSYDSSEHRSCGRLYSDEVWNEQQHSQQSSGKSVQHSTRTISHSSQGKRIVHSDEKKQKSKETKLLALELNEVDRQIQDNKKELLKSMLRKERLELLQKNLHGGESSVADASTMLQRSTDGAGVKTTSEMEKELELLNRAITDGKKQLLRVMKKMEEEQIEMN